MTSPNPILSTLENFPLVYSAMVKPDDGCAPPSTSRARSDGARQMAKRRSHIFDKDFSAMSRIKLTIDGVEITAEAGQTIMEAADAAGIYIPRLCDHEGLRHQGGCRVCTVKATGAAWRPARNPRPGAGVENETPHVTKMRRDLVEMLFHEGNHLCPICEASGNCELQAMAYRLDMTARRAFPIWSPAARSMPPIPTSRSTPTAASPAGAASAPRRISMARASSAMWAGAFTAGSP
jgi:ferredoxin